MIQFKTVYWREDTRLPMGKLTRTFLVICVSMGKNELTRLHNQHQQQQQTFQQAACSKQKPIEHHEQRSLETTVYFHFNNKSHTISPTRSCCRQMLSSSLVRVNGPSKCAHSLFVCMCVYIGCL